MEWPALRAGLNRGAELVAAALFAILFGAFMIQITFRYVFNHPVPWSLELCQLSYVWLVFWSSNLILGERQHILFDLLYKKFQPPARRLVAIGNTASLGLVFLIALPVTVEYISFMGRRVTDDLRIPRDIAFSCFVIFMVAVIVGAAKRLRRLSGASWQQHL